MDYIKQRTVRKHCKIKQVYAMLGYDFLFENCTYSDINSTHVLKINWTVFKSYMEYRVEVHSIN